MEKKAVYEFPFRSTRMGALTKAIVVCLQCKKVLSPSRVQRSKTGNHGSDFYVHEHPVTAIILEQSNSGKRTITVPSELSEIKDLLEVTWLYENSDVNDVVNAVRAYLLSLSKS
jgi:hypothetical protein